MQVCASPAEMVLFCAVGMEGVLVGWGGATVELVVGCSCVDAEVTTSWGVIVVGVAWIPWHALVMINITGIKIGSS